MPYFPDNDKSKMYTSDVVSNISHSSHVAEIGSQVIPRFLSKVGRFAGRMAPPFALADFYLTGQEKSKGKVGNLDAKSAFSGGKSWNEIKQQSDWSFQNGGNINLTPLPSLGLKKLPVPALETSGPDLQKRVAPPGSEKQEAPGAAAYVGAATTAVDLGKTAFGKGSAEGTQDVGAGALEGAAKGAMAGAAFGPWGAVIGGAVGGVSGAVGAKKNIEAFEEQEEKESEQLLIAEGKEGATEAEEKRLLSQQYLAEKRGKYGMKTSNMYQEGGSLNNPRLLEYAPNFKFKSGGQTKGAYSHKTNPLTVIDKNGNDTGMELTGGEGVYDKMAQESMENAIKNKNYAKAGMIVENEIQDWKRRGMYT